jgi:hypothetical protein
MYTFDAFQYRKAIVSIFRGAALLLQLSRD